MVSSVLFTGLASLLVSQATAVPAIVARDLSSFITTERAFSLTSALNNIGPNGSAVSGAGSGFVIASPSKSNPDYFYTWSRDAALTLTTIINEFIFGNTDLQATIDAYVSAQATLQTVDNPSGAFLPDGLGLGEPKFNADGTQFTGAWGRPQRDGPALRAIALITYSNWLIQNSQQTKAQTIWKIISNDLSYVGQYWNQTGFDLWEEVQGSSFFTIQNQHKSLVQGAALAQTLGVTCTGCDQAPEVLCFLQSFWNGKYIVANINENNGRTGLDANTILGPIAVFDVDGDCDGLTFQPCNSKSLANFKALVDSFRSVYTINSGIAQGSGVAIGRYAEDTYQGGNPWYLATTAAAEFLYDAVAQWTARKSITIDDTSLAFFTDIYPSAAAGSYSSSTDNTTFTAIVDAVNTYADSFLSIVQKYTPTAGSLAEQFDRGTGAPLSASDLTWSYAAFVTVSQRRGGQYPASWGSTNITAPPATCSSSSTPGSYTPATS